jgi:DNA-binding transcriptional LysR family regulator
MGQDVVHRPTAGALSTNDIDAELQAILAGSVIGQASRMYAGPLVRAGKLILVLTEHVTEHLGLYLYYGSRAAQPQRVRAFIDLVTEQLAANPAFVLSAKELAAALRRRGHSVR